ncbi:MAG: hypothetical protein JNL82_22125 [Myxococcales bacterium]|nr:hypothetical protein [Myxococcales bacterium]
MTRPPDDLHPCTTPKPSCEPEPAGQFDADPPNSDDTLVDVPPLEDAELVGEYPSVEEYLRDMLEPEISPACTWLLDYLDWDAVLLKFEEDGARYVCQDGQVFRINGS